MDRYEEAMERAKAGKPMDEVFPELKESEDERIRKALVKTFEKKLEIGFEWTEFGIPNRSVLDWLEKQKEPLAPEEKMNHPLYLEGFDVGKKVGEVLEEQKPAEWSEDLDAEVKRFFDECVVVHAAKIYGGDTVKVIAVSNYELTARHFAEWGAEHARKEK